MVSAHLAAGSKLNAFHKKIRAADIKCENYDSRVELKNNGCPDTAVVRNPTQLPPIEGNRNCYQSPALRDLQDIPFGIDNPSEKESSENSFSTISPSFIREFSRIYKWLRRIDASPPCSISEGSHNGNEETSNRDNIVQRTPNPQRRRVSRLSIENQSTPSDDGAKRRRLKTRLVILLTFIVLCVVISGVAFAIYHFIQKEVSDGEQVFSGILKVNETFNYEMADSNSPKFQSFEKRFCSNIESVLIQNVSSGRCKMNSLSNGSIIVNFTLVISDHRSVNQIQDLLICLFNGTQVGAMTVDSRATRFTFNPGGNEGRFSKEMKSSSCSFDSLPILPMDYTYPDYCGDYRMCRQGNTVLMTCPQGKEFAYLTRDGSAYCTLPSNNTYCGMKKLENTANRFEWVAFSLCSGILIAFALPDLNV